MAGRSSHRGHMDGMPCFNAKNISIVLVALPVILVITMSASGAPLFVPHVAGAVTTGDTTVAEDKEYSLEQDVFSKTHTKNEIMQSSDSDRNDRYDGFVSLGKKVFSWTDKVHITIIAPDHNFNSRAIDTIGDTKHNSVKITTRESSLREYRLTETGPNTGIFTGEVTLIGFDHNADGDTRTGSNSQGYDNPQRTTGGKGPTGGYIASSSEDAITVSFEYTNDHTAVGTALIRWNVAEVQWLESTYPASGTGIIRVIEPDMNLNPESMDNFEVDVWSDADPSGITLTVTEKGEASGIFEGAVAFRTSDKSSGERLRVAEGDQVTASYEDNTLPKPYTTADGQDIKATAQIGLATSPLERVRVAGINIIDALGMDIGNEISAGQQVQVMSQLTNMQDKRGQPFVYIVMVKDKDSDSAVSISWIKGHLQPEQTLNAATSWMPSESGTYEINAFVWESIVSPSALAPPSQVTVIVN